MSKFYKYAERLNEIAKESFNEYNKALAEVKKAESERIKKRDGWSSQQFQEWAEKEHRYQLSKENLNHAINNMKAKKKEISKIRGELEEEIHRYYSLDPGQLSPTLMAVLNTGVASSYDLQLMMDDSARAENWTDFRVIGSYAKQKAEETKDEKEAQRLRAIAHDGLKVSGQDILRTFDELSFCFDRTSENPAMISHWDSLTAEVIDEF